MHQGRYFTNPVLDPERLRAEQLAKEAAARARQAEAEARSQAEAQRRYLDEERRSVAARLDDAVRNVLSDLNTVSRVGWLGKEWSILTYVPAAPTYSSFRTGLGGTESRAIRYNSSEETAVWVRCKWGEGTKLWGLEAWIHGDDGRVKQATEIRLQLGPALHRATNLPVWVNGSRYPAEPAPAQPPI